MRSAILHANTANGKMLSSHENLNTNPHKPANGWPLTRSHYSLTN